MQFNESGIFEAKFQNKSLHFISFKSEVIRNVIHTSFFSYFLSFHSNTYPGRTGRNGTISVRALDGPKASIMPSTYHSASPPGYTILDVDANAMLFVGGLTGKLKVMCFSPSISVDSSRNGDFGQRQNTTLQNLTAFYLICFCENMDIL